MKKTLVAIAALSIVGSAVAQVTISGQIAVGARKDGAVTTVGRTDGNINVKSVENLGGGMTLTANGGLDLAARTAPVAARNFGLTLSSTTAGTLAYSSNLANKLSRLTMGGAVALGEDLDDLYGAGYQLSAISYTAPKMGNVTLSYGINQATTTGLATTGDIAKSGTFGGVYAAGPLSIGVNYAPDLGRTRADFSFDAKVAVIEAHMNSSYTGGTSPSADAFSEFGIAVPMGAMTLGAGYSTKGTTSGTAVGVSYALSKQTSIVTSYASFKNLVAPATAAEGAHTQIKLNHNF